jgi:hypothetical protein
VFFINLFTNFENPMIGLLFRYCGSALSALYESIL